MDRVGASDWAMAAAAIAEEIDEEAKTAAEALVALEMQRLYAECDSAATASYISYVM